MNQQNVLIKFIYLFFLFTKYDSSEAKNFIFTDKESFVSKCIFLCTVLGIKNHHERSRAPSYEKKSNNEPISSSDIDISL